ncbi:MAG: putative FmdB family regulatory protein [Paracoccaceae bacterium]|jgi:putative FmdB family regulatory protein
MPIYEYRCGDCKHELEAIQKMSDAALVDCPSCEQPALKKLISAAAFRLKGGGWYETDFKSGSKKNLVGDSGAKSESSAGAASSAAPSSAPASTPSSSGSSTSSSSGSDAG